MDTVIPIAKGATWKEELKYILRAWDRYYEDLDTVYLVGNREYLRKTYPWLKGVKIVECEDRFNRNKDANLIRKVIKAIEAGVSDPFIRASDDQFLLRKIEDFSPKYSIDLNEKSRDWWNTGSRWKNRLKRTHRILFIKGKTVYNYDTHVPAVVGHDFKEIMERYPYTKSIGYTINTLYFNNALKTHEKADKIRTMIRKPLEKEELKKRMWGKNFLCYSGKDADEALNEPLKDIIRNKFKSKSKFEK